jgi:predicted nucleic acid-binding protein
MADNIVLIDTSILIEYFRKSDKSNSKLIALLRGGYKFHISSITEYEIYAGANLNQQSFWEELLEKTEELPFDRQIAKVAVEINNQLKRNRKQIAIADLFIAAKAAGDNLPFATLNIKHFERIDKLLIVA